MTDPTATPDRPVPRWLYIWAVLTAAVTFVTLIVLGQMVTSLRAGMEDPVWPTEPWYLFFIDWREPTHGFLIEHTHRLAGFAVGGLVSVLVLGVWGTDPRSGPRWAGLAALAVLLVAFGQFHRELMAQKLADRVVVPTAPLGAMFIALVLVGRLGVTGLSAGVRGSGLRLFAVGVLVAVMVQGLLGGFRVRLNELVGPELAPVHGVFGQVTFSLLVALAVLTGRPPRADLPEPARGPVRHLTLVLLVLLVVQLVWGALVRHLPGPLNQRLHLLTAFLVVGTAVWLLKVGLAPAARPRVYPLGWVLGGLVAVQVTLGVEAWMGKFGDEARQAPAAAGKSADERPVTRQQAFLRTAHALTGTGLLAAAVGLAVGVRRSHSVSWVAQASRPVGQTGGVG